MSAKCLKHKINGRIFPWTAALARKTDMIPCTPEGIETGKLDVNNGNEKAFVDLTKTVNKQANEILDLKAYIVKLEAEVSVGGNLRDDRKGEYEALSRKDLMGLALSKGIANAPQKFKSGKEYKLIALLLDQEFTA